MKKKVLFGWQRKEKIHDKDCRMVQHSLKKGILPCLIFCNGYVMTVRSLWLISFYATVGNSVESLHVKLQGNRGNSGNLTPRSIIYCFLEDFSFVLTENISTIFLLTRVTHSKIGDTYLKGTLWTFTNWLVVKIRVHYGFLLFSINVLI